MKRRPKLEFHFIAMAAYGKGISGGDRIFIELARRWSQEHPVTIYSWEEGIQMLKRQKFSGQKLEIRNWRLGNWARLGFAGCYLLRIIKAVEESFKLELENRSTTIVYSSSEFWMDSFPALVLKFRHPKIIWVATWYQTAPNPLKGFKEGTRKSGYRDSALFYWLAQLPVKPLIKRWADFVLINNKEERKQFLGLDKKGRAVVVLGAVDLRAIGKWKGELREEKKIYDAVFQGRFHPQKGVVELIAAWKRVAEKVPGARLAMIGDGPLMESVRRKVRSEKLESSVKLFGYVFDGPKKYKIFSQSRIVVHPAFYDSGGMASAEAMAFGLPCVGFNLKAYQSYYPRGMIKVETGNLDGFAEKIVDLLKNQKRREKIGQEALKMIERNWSWDKRAEEVLKKIVDVVPARKKDASKRQDTDLCEVKQLPRRK